MAVHPFDGELMAQKLSRRVKKASRRPPMRRRRPVRPRPGRARPSGSSVSTYNRIELDLVREAFRRSNPTFLSRLESLFAEREVVEVEGLLRLTASVMKALAARGFSRVDHWEVHPGGWLPLPEPAHERLEEPVGHLLNALRSEAWKRISGARSFAARLSGAGELRADMTVRRVHRERGHAVTVELFGPASAAEIRSLVGSLREEMTIARVRRSSS